MRPLAISGAVALGVLLPTRVSAAHERFNDRTLQFGIGPNYGYYVGEDEEIPDTRGPGVHLTSGYTLSMGMYVGGEFNYFVGSTETVEYEGVLANINWQLMQFGVELGYDYALEENLVLRPKLGVGYARLLVDVHAEDVFGTGDLRFEDSYGGIAVPLGVELLYALGEHWFLGAKVRYGYTTITVDVRDENLQKVGERDQHAHGIVLGFGLGARF